MRYILTMLIAFHWMAVFAMLAMVSTVDPQHGILPALRFLGADALARRVPRWRRAVGRGIAGLRIRRQQACCSCGPC